jgi:hypothetical protein
MPPVLGTASYIDSVQIQQKAYFRAEVLRHFAAHCGWVIRGEMPTYGGRVIQTCWLHQPDRAAIEGIVNTPASIVRAHVALDFLTTDRVQAEQVQRYLTPRLALRMDPTEPLYCDRGTTYFEHKAPSGRRRQIVVYSDKPSKVFGAGPCCHVEFRMEGARYLLSNRVRTVQDLLDLDHNAFWAENLRLFGPPKTREVGEYWCQSFVRSRSRRSAVFPYNDRETSIGRVGALILRAAMNRDGQVVVNNWLHQFGKNYVFERCDMEEMLRALPTTDLLPPAGNGLWAD